MGLGRYGPFLVAAQAAVALTLVTACGTTGAETPVKEAVPTEAVRPDCDEWFQPLVVLVTCDGLLSGEFTLSDPSGRALRSFYPSRVAQLLGAPLRPGDRVALSGKAAKETKLVALFVTRAGRAVFFRFDDLGLREGGRSVLTVTGGREAPTFRLRQKGGRVLAPTKVVVSPDRRYVADLAVGRRGRRLAIAFTAAGTTTEVFLVSHEAAEDLVEEGELEGGVVSLKTIPTSPGGRVRISTPAPAGAEYVYVVPLARRGQLGPALAKIPEE